MILVNESYRIKLSPQDFKKINIEGFKPDQCTWYCEVPGCDPAKHVRLINSRRVNQLYNKIISTNNMMGRGNYELSNIIFLVILWPLFMYILLIKCIDIQQKIKEIKKKK